MNKVWLAGLGGAMAGLVISTTTRRVVCMAMTKLRSTLLAAATIATVSSPPGLVAR